MSTYRGVYGLGSEDDMMLRRLGYAARSAETWGLWIESACLALVLLLAKDRIRK